MARFVALKLIRLIIFRHSAACQGPTFTCPRCGKLFPKKNTFDKHTLLCGQDLSNFQCETCKKLFTRKFNLQRHKEQCGQNKVEHSCHRCPKTFSRYDNLGEHLAKEHRGRNPDYVTVKEKCIDCLKEYSSQFALLNHECREFLKNFHLKNMYM